MKPRRSHLAVSALSLLEVLTAVALVGTIVAFALPRIGGLKQGVDDVKLYSDVAVINSAVKVYLSNGGTLGSSATVEEVIEKVGRAVSADEADTFVGFTGAMVENTLQATWMTDSKIPSGRTRAVWNASQKRFEITDKPVAGISGFTIGGEEPDQTRDSQEEVEGRTSSLKYASDTNWIWDYTDAAVPPPSAPEPVPLGTVVNRAPPGVPTPTTPTSGPAKLAPPALTKPPGSYPVSDFLLPVGLIDPNPVGSSRIFYKRPGGNWTEFGGSDLAIQAGEEILAYAVPINSTIFEASNLVRGSYTATPLKLSLVLTAESRSVNYFDLVSSRGNADLRVTNLNEIPESMREQGLFNTFYGANGVDPSEPGRGTLAGTYEKGYEGDVIPLHPEMWNGESELTLKAFAKSSREEWIGSSNLSTLTVQAEKLPLSPPLITMRESKPGEFMVSLELDGRYPPGTQIFYTTSGDPPSWDEATGRVINGLPYVGPFALDVELEQPEEKPGDTLDIGNGVNDVKISQVVLTSNGRRIEQNQSYYFDTLDNPGFDGGRANEVVDRSNDRIELQSITIQHEGKEIVADNVNVLGVTVANLNISSNARDSDITVKRDGRVVADLGDRFPGNSNGKGNAHSGGHKNSLFAREVEATLKSTNLRDYIDYSTGSRSNLDTDYDFDVMFSPLTNSDFLVVMERFGNSTFDLRPLDAAGNPIPGGNRLVFRAYSWNTGHAPSDTGGQAMFFSVIDVKKFGVNTDLNSISGFRLNNDGGADFKFFTISDRAFEDREVRFTGQIQARVFPPESLRNWFDPSEFASRDVEGVTTVSTAP